MVNAQTFRFLNVIGDVRDESGWNDTSRSRLWCYNSHYFDDLNAIGAPTRAPWHRALIGQWIAENPAAAGAGWESYPTSLRIVNWIKWSVARVGRGGDGLDETARDSLAMQVRWLAKRLEIHLLGNHLWANAKALAFAGAYFGGDEADGWLSTGLDLLERELEEQILPDGGHFERSPMYHAIVLEDVLDLINLLRLFDGAVLARLERRLQPVAVRMLRWLQVMTHPDGQIALFNDAAFGIAPCEAELRAYARRLGVPVNEEPLATVEALPQSGYVRLQNARAVIICDVAPLGPDYLPGHAHADTLSFEFSLDGSRVVVDSGTSTYAAGGERHRQRGTAAHNTVEVNQLDSSEVWGSFRVARRAQPFAVRWGGGALGQWVEGAHDGYRRTSGRVTHHRRWTLQDSAFTIDDRLDGSFLSAVAALHLHPGVSVGGVQPGDHVTGLVLPNGRTVAVTTTPLAELSAHPSTWHPEFGIAKASVALRVPMAGPSLSIRLSW